MNAIQPLAVIVEDNALMADLFSRALGEIQYTTMIFRDGRKALAWLRKNEPDLLILDLHLPHLSGKDILEEIGDDPRFKTTQIILVTADARMGGMIQHKADYLVNKPVDIGQLQTLAKRLKQEMKR